MHKRQKAPFSGPKINTLITHWASKTLHKTPYTYVHFLKRAVSNLGGSTQATRGCGGVSLFISELISVLVFDVFKIPSGCIAPSCTPLATILGITSQFLHPVTQICSELIILSDKQKIIKLI